MSYKINQEILSLENERNYVTVPNVNTYEIKEDIESSFSIGSSMNRIFEDIGILRTGNQNFVKDNTYYFKGTLKSQTKNLLAEKIDITISLCNLEQNSPSGNSQFIDSFSIIGEKTIELIFTPQANYTCLFFKISRTYIDFLFSEGLSIKLDNMEFYRINNILENNKVIKKIGIQGKPGLKMIINHEGFWMNPTGIFEINDSYNIDFLGFVITTTNKAEVLAQPVLIDYLTQE